MDDEKIVAMFWERSENAIAEIKRKYDGYCGVIARNILGTYEDAEECLNDTWLSVWNSIPPKKPETLPHFIGRITRNIAINYIRRRNAEKRGSGQIELCLEELAECTGSGESISEDIELRTALEGFLDTLKPGVRKLFMQRYWYMYSVTEIAVINEMSEGAVKMQLYRTRESLREYLEKEGIEV